MPLVAAFAAILLGTVVLAIYRQSTAWPSHMADFMGMFFLVFGFMKVIRLKGFAEAYAMYDIIAMRSHVYAMLYPFVELALAVGYFTRYNPVLINSIVIVLMIVGIIGIYKKLQKKETIQCACLGVVFKLPMTKVTLAEDGLMLLMAVVMLSQSL